MALSISLLGAGWLGLPLAYCFKDKGAALKVACRSQQGLTDLISAGFNAYRVDIDQSDDTNADYSIRDFLKSDCLLINIPSKNLEGFERLISLVEQSTIKFVIFVSSTSVYGDASGLVSESDDREGVGLENESLPLRKIERYFINNPNFSSTVVRFGGLIGPSRHPGRFFLSGKPVKNSDWPVNLIHLVDCLNILQGIIEKNLWNEVFNCVADTHPTKREFYSRAALDYGLPIPDFGSPSKNALSSEGKIILNNKIKKKLAYEFVYGDLMAMDFSTAFK